VKKDAVNPTSVFRSLEHGFSQAVVASGRRTLYVSGQTAWDSQKRLIGGADLEEQARQAFAKQTSRAPRTCESDSVHQRRVRGLLAGQAALS